MTRKYLESLLLLVGPEQEDFGQRQAGCFDERERGEDLVTQAYLVDGFEAALFVCLRVDQGRVVEAWVFCPAVRALVQAGQRVFVEQVFGFFAREALQVEVGPWSSVCAVLRKPVVFCACETGSDHASEGVEENGCVSLVQQQLRIGQLLQLPAVEGTLLASVPESAEESGELGGRPAWFEVCAVRPVEEEAGELSGEAESEAGEVADDLVVFGVVEQHFPRVGLEQLAHAGQAAVQTEVEERLDCWMDRVSHDETDRGEGAVEDQQVAEVADCLGRVASETAAVDHERADGQA